MPACLVIFSSTLKLLRTTLCVLASTCLLSGAAYSSAPSAPNEKPAPAVPNQTIAIHDSPHLATSWLEIRSLNDSDLLRLSSGANSISDRITARARLTQAERDINRSLESAAAQLTAAKTLIEPASDEAAFANAMACQIATRQGQPTRHKRCLQLNSLGYQVSSTVVRAFIELTKAHYLSRDSQHDKAEASAQLASELALVSTDAGLIAGTKNWAGVQFKIQGMSKLALRQYEDAWSYAEQTNIEELKQIIRFNMASIYSQLDRHDDALAIFEEALAWPMANVNQARKVTVRALMALSLIGSNQPDRAEALLLDVIPSQLNEVQPDIKIQAYSALAQAQLAQRKMDSAINNFENSMALMVDYNSPRGNAAKVPYAGALRQVGRAAEAREILESVIKDIPTDSPNEIMLEALTELAATHSTLGEPAKATRATTRAAAVAKQLSSVAVEYQLSRIQNAIEHDQHVQAISLAKEREQVLQTIANNESTLRYVSLLLAALLLAVIYLFFSRRLQSTLIHAERAANEGLEAQVESRTAELETQMADRLEAEVERRHLLAKLAEGEKMRALGQLTAGVAHDFNNLMTAVTLTAEYLKNDSGESEQKRESLLDDILSATDSAARITGGLLAYARQQPLQPKVLQLDEFLEESELIFGNTLGERNLLRTSYVPCSVVVDQGQLASALLNLLLNAKDALGERGTVEISLTIEQGTDELQANPFAVISVRDSGCGMNANDLQRATEPFFTTKPVGEGSGLGLSMVYGFAHQSGGHISLKSEYGKGTTVRLALPAATAVVNSDKSPQPLRQRVPHKNMRVLIVEDRASVLQMLKLSLEQMGISTSAARNAEEALASVATLGAPDLLLSDIDMPGELDGNQLARMLKARNPELPVVMMSGYSERVDSDYEFLPKPFTNEQLERALLGALDRVAGALDASSSQKRA